MPIQKSLSRSSLVTRPDRFRASGSPSPSRSGPASARGDMRPCLRGHFTHIGPGVYFVPSASEVSTLVASCSSESDAVATARRLQDVLRVEIGAQTCEFSGGVEHSAEVRAA